ncbi:replication-associated protein [Sewage-associated circular DNA virus-36]|uniref:replication-associated protein n=1 Tax=Sewage-associated circular DNA virus-36 TaxID=1592103 RepID=UPI000585F7F5|nr:replication-associated protein [Sewage-associated circular DNA virus-36]AJD07519.1 replication-associated protein [Sewage-associated circular DNA virus-36]
MARTPRTNAQRYFLTYSQAHALDIDDLANFLHALAPSWLEIVQENHQDDGIHYHVVLCFDERFQRALDVFDLDNHHPNIAIIKNASGDLNNRRHYIRKGADRPKESEHTIADHKKGPCDYIIEPDTRGEVPPYSTSAGRLNWGGILESAKSEEEFLILVRVNQPTEWVLRNDSIVKYAKTHYKAAREPEKVYPPESWVVPPALDDWVAEVFSDVSTRGVLPRPDRPKTLLLVGPTRLGKSVWAKSLGRYSYMCGMWHSDEFDESAQYLILDDFEFDFFHGMRKAIWGAQEVFTTTDKWRKGVARWGKPTIWICQEEHNPFTAVNRKTGLAVMDETERDWYKQNCVEVHVNTKFIRLRTCSGRSNRRDII